MIKKYLQFINENINNDELYKLTEDELQDLFIRFIDEGYDIEIVRGIVIELNYKKLFTEIITSGYNNIAYSLTFYMDDTRRKSYNELLNNRCSYLIDMSYDVFIEHRSSNQKIDDFEPSDYHFFELIIMEKTKTNITTLDIIKHYNMNIDDKSEIINDEVFVKMSLDTLIRTITTPDYYQVLKDAFENNDNDVIIDFENTLEQYFDFHKKNNIYYFKFDNRWIEDVGEPPISVDVYDLFYIYYENIETFN